MPLQLFKAHVNRIRDLTQDVTGTIQKKGLCPIYREKYYDDAGEPE
jgi:hypothetical protein